MRKANFMVAVAILMFIMQTFFNPSIFAADNNLTTNYSYLNSENEILFNLGLLKGFEKKIIDDNEVTRAEFISVINKMIGTKGVISGEQIFSDVPESHFAFGEVFTAVKLGIINRDLTFRPDDAITKNEMTKILVSILGYNLIAESKGGYPAGYEIVAREIGIKNLGQEKITWKSILPILSKVMQTEIMEQVSFGDTKQYKTSGEHLLKKVFNVEKINGIVTETKYSGLYEISSSKKGIKIGERRFNISSENVEWLGQYVTAFVKDLEQDFPEIISIYAENAKNNIIKVDSDYISENTTRQNLKYFKDDEKEKEYSVKFSSQLSVIYNGEYLSEYKIEDLIPKNGHIEIIDNNSDGRYDVLKVFNAIAYVVKYIDYKEMIIYDLYGKTPIELSKTDIIFDIYKNDKKININDIAIDNTVLVEISKNSNILALKVSDMLIQGSITALSDDYIYINDTQYKLCDDYKAIMGTKTEYPLIELGLNGQFFVDSNYKITGVKDKKQEASYGYLIKSKYKSDISGENLQIKVLMSNSTILIMDSKNELLLNGIKNSASEVYTAIKDLNDIIYIETNSEGKIKRIDTPVPDSNILSLSNVRFVDRRYATYRYQQRAFDIGFWQTGYPMTSNTVVFLETLSNGKLYNEEIRASNMYYFAGDWPYTFRIYNTSKSGIPKIVVCEIAPGNNNIEKGNLFILDKITKVIDEDGNDTYKIYGLHEGIQQSFTLIESGKLTLNDYTTKSAIDTSIPTFSVDSLETGDMLKIFLDNKNTINRIDWVFSKNTFQSIRNVPNPINTVLTYGEVYSKEEDVVNIKVPDGSERTINLIGNVKYYELNTNTGKMTTITKDAVLVGDKAFVNCVNHFVNDVVLIK